MHTCGLFTVGAKRNSEKVDISQKTRYGVKSITPVLSVN